MTSSRGFIRTILLMALVLSLAGCGETLLDPATPSGDPAPIGGDPVGEEPLAGPEILVITEGETVRYTKLRAEPVDGTAEPVTGRAIHTSAVIDGEAGGQLQCGRFLLAVPAGAFEGEGTVSMSMADETVMIVDVEITPSELNNFRIPVKLFLLTEGTNVPVEDIQIYWWDPDKSEWKAMGCDRDLSDDVSITGTTEGLLTNLSHFSRYSGGKAGW